MSGKRTMQLRKWLWFGAAIVGLLSCGAPTPGSAEDLGKRLSVRFAPEQDYGPFVFQGEDGQVRGLSIDMLDAIAARGGLQITTLPPSSLAEILDAAERGEVDLISSLRPTPERAAFLAFTHPYVSVPAVLIRRADQDDGRQLADLAGQPVAVGLGYAVEGFVRTAFPEVDWVGEPDDSAALRDLLAGKVVGVVADLASVTFLTRRHHLDRLRVVGAVGFNYPLSFAYAKNRPDIGRALEAGLAALGGRGRDAIVGRWVDHQDLTYRDSRTAVILEVAGGLVALSAGLLAFGLWQRTKRRAGAS